MMHLYHPRGVPDTGRLDGSIKGIGLTGLGETDR